MLVTRLGSLLMSAILKSLWSSVLATFAVRLLRLVEFSMWMVTALLAGWITCYYMSVVSSDNASRKASAGSGRCVDGRFIVSSPGSSDMVCKWVLCGVYWYDGCEPKAYFVAEVGMSRRA